MKKQRSFFPIFRVFISIVIFLFFATESFFAKDYKIETSRGIQTVSIPDNYTTEEAFLEMSKLYLEERLDYEELLNQMDPLLSSLKSYEKQVEDLKLAYEDSLKKERELANLYKQASKVTLVAPSLLTGVYYQFEEANLSASLSFGVSLLEKFHVYTTLSYPISIGLQVGVTF